MTENYTPQEREHLIKVLLDYAYDRADELADTASTWQVIVDDKTSDDVTNYLLTDLKNAARDFLDVLEAMEDPQDFPGTIGAALEYQSSFIVPNNSPEEPGKA